MTSTFPGALDSFATNHATDQPVLAATDNDHADAINKIEAELGVNPSGSAATVAARLTDAEALIATGAGNTVGHDAIGTDATTANPGNMPNGWPTSGTHWFVIPITLTETCVLSPVEVYLRDRVGATGTQDARAGVFAESSGPTGLPLAIGSSTTLTNPSADAWTSLPWGTSPTLPAGTYHVGVWYGLNGTVNQAKVMVVTTAASGATQEASDAITAPASTAFGTKAPKPWVASIRVVATPATMDSVEVQEAGTKIGDVTVFNFAANANVEVVSGVANVTPLGELPPDERIIVGDAEMTSGYHTERPARHAVTLDGFEIENGATYTGPSATTVAGASVDVRSRAAQTAGTAGLKLHESVDDGASWYPLVPDGNVVALGGGYYGGALTAPVGAGRKVRATYTQGTASGAVEIVRAVHT